ncbi:DUF6894 family protein [Mesorhizobium australicum]|uniref:DUF6894 family protein n=1 Tax=Mesorhizobium australicum TaxID=536018 RepID=UPI003EBF88A1
MTTEPFSTTIKARSARATVRYEATRAIAEMTRDALRTGDHHKLTMIVRDSGGDLVFRASILFEVEPSASHLSGRRGSGLAHGGKPASDVVSMNRLRSIVLRLDSLIILSTVRSGYV